MSQPARPDVLAEICARWSLTAGPAYPGGTAATVVRVCRADGTPAVLKLARRHFEAEDEASGLRVWDGAGAVRLLDFLRYDETTDALLLEACEPGTPALSLPEHEQDEVVCGLLRRLWVRPPADRPFRPLVEMCDAWAAGLDIAQATARLGDAGLARAGAELFRQLPRDGVGVPVLLVTDLHAGNVLAAEREPWLMIDPKPYVGDPTYDLCQHMLNCTERVLADPRAFAARLASLVELDADRLLRWLFARCVVECDDQPALADLALLLRGFV